MNLPPKPVPDADTQPFWDACSEHRLVIPRCGTCSTWIWQPRPLCPACHGDDIVWEQVSGAATITSWTVIHPPVLPVWSEEVPFVVLLVELVDAPGVRLVGRFVDEEGSFVHSDEQIGFGTAVLLRWRTDESGTFPAWSVT